MSFDIASSNEKETQFVDDKIVAFNKSHVPLTQDNDFVSLNFHIKNESGLVIPSPEIKFTFVMLRRATPDVSISLK